MWRLELREPGDPMKKTVPEFPQKSEPLRARFLRDQKVKIDGIPNVSEKNDCVRADKQTRQSAFGGGSKDCDDFLFHDDQIRLSNVHPARLTPYFPFRRILRFTHSFPISASRPGPSMSHRSRRAPFKSVSYQRSGPVVSAFLLRLSDRAQIALCRSSDCDLGVRQDVSLPPSAVDVVE
jgi:hypothetical protein